MTGAERYVAQAIAGGYHVLDVMRERLRGLGAMAAALRQCGRCDAPAPTHSDPCRCRAGGAEVPHVHVTCRRCGTSAVVRETGPETAGNGPESAEGGVVHG